MSTETSEMDADAATWWSATRDKRLLIQRCERCGHHQHYPRMLCVVCGADTLAWATASGHGTVYSFTVVHRAPSPEFTPPYVIALVRLAEGPLLLTRIVDADPALAACDQPVVLRWRRLEDGRHLPVFALAAAGSG